MAEMGAELFIDTFGHLYSQANLQNFLDRIHSTSAVQSDLESGRHFWIAEIEHRWIGYAKGGPVGVPVELGPRKSLELKQLYVRRDFHGQGVSHLLMSEFLRWARECEAVDAYVSCWSENYRALAFYRKYGFEEVGSYTFFVGDHQDDERILRARLD